ncbi:4Fe-4S dicluster domain-containing protein [Anaerocolumna jejuensis DSM 15929]|uniref:Ferredoxin n=1 Tax=Anaerocolumna jejuensis DSM 15929 TaxID=1121322 RepID=A0A1M7C9D1_9FIRM|nr:EFR1 family ferrodoxin [Anaerocolumna jejuensis]SHL63469.1 4Fe-4S dicluster domain-containing protein [Anaerocolumna jejuensis DSM 15929]
MKIFYFTATGNSLAVAKQLGGELISIPQIMREKKTEYQDNVIGIVFPVYANEPPKMVQDFLEKVNLKAEFCFAIATYGMMSGNPFKYVQRITEKHGYKFDYTRTLLMVDNFLDNFDVKKEVAKIEKKNIQKNLNILKRDISAHKKDEMRAGIISNAVTKMCEPLYRGIVSGKTSDKFIVNNSCIQCGICSKVCPAGNISVKEKVMFSMKCEGCYACIHSCPKNAIHLKNEKSNERWLNPEVSIKEIIDSNCQI